MTEQDRTVFYGLAAALTGFAALAVILAAARDWFGADAVVAGALTGLGTAVAVAAVAVARWWAVESDAPASITPPDRRASQLAFPYPEQAAPSPRPTRPGSGPTAAPFGGERMWSATGELATAGGGRR